MTAYAASLEEKGRQQGLQQGAINEYGILYSNEIERSVDDMCNVSQGIREKSKAEGVIMGKVELLMQMGKTAEQIAKQLNISVSEVNVVISTLEN